MSGKKSIHQPLDANGKPAAQARSAPAWFAKDSEQISIEGMTRIGESTHTAWGQLFGSPHKGNDVDFFVTGAEYFKSVAACTLDGLKGKSYRLKEAAARLIITSDPA